MQMHILNANLNLVKNLLKDSTNDFLMNLLIVIEMKVVIKN